MLLVTEFIQDDMFWEKQYKTAYGPRIVTTLKGKWMQIYLEKNLQEWLEKMHPNEFDEETVRERLELYAPHIERLTIHNFQPPPKHEIHHIPLNFIQILRRLRAIDLYVTVKDPDTNGDFSDCGTNFSDKDIEALCTGIEACDLIEFRFGGTIVRPAMAKRLGSALEKCVHLKKLHIVDCSLADEGVIAFLMGIAPDSMREIEDLSLANNCICEF